MKGYARYSLEYDKAEAKLKAWGYAPAYAKLSEADFEIARKIKIMARKREIAEGKRKVVGNVYRDIVQRQMATATSKQAPNLKRAYEKHLGKKLTLRQIMYGSNEAKLASDELNILIEKDYKKRRELGETKEQALKYISQHYFES